LDHPRQDQDQKCVSQDQDQDIKTECRDQDLSLKNYITGMKLNKCYCDTMQYVNI